MSATKQMEDAVFYAASSMTDAAQRQLFLDQACAGNTSLRVVVEEMLSAHDAAEPFFAKGRVALTLPAGQIPAIAAADEAMEQTITDEYLGTPVGRYKLLQRIGEGGCGVVYMAEQEQPVRRRVALKIIKLGMDTKSVIARFDAERQALALMDHPNISRVLDAGATEAGRPYFVMELVRGFKITEYCDQNNLDTRQRLDLFVQVCHAIQHAHQKGIIHRDIKPSNILVTMHDGVPVPKVIDFGIAKAIEGKLTEQTLFTAYEQLIGTPAYMSPEQAEMSGLDVDTRSDIYSLGVLLYELLTGKTPFDQKELLQSGLVEMRRKLREDEPQRPSTILTTLQGTELRATAQHRHAEPPRLISLLKGDLDWIVMKALEKDRVRRYETANGLAMDVQRYLGNEPIVARPPSRLYRLQKLVHRNRVTFAATIAVALTLVSGLTAITWALVKERAAHRRAVDAEQEQSRLRREAESREKITQVALLVTQENMEEADRIASAINFSNPTIEGAAVLRALGDWHAVHGRWKAAAARFKALQQVNQLDNWDVTTLDILELGPVLIELGDLNGYELFRRESLERFARTTYPTADRLIKICLLTPASEKLLADLATQAELAERAFDQETASPAPDVFQSAWRSVSLALWEFRRGRHAKAAEWARRCLAYPEFNAPRAATAHIILAMACWGAGQQEIARTELQLGREMVEGKFRAGLDRGTGVQGFWFDWVFARILLREAGSVVDVSPLSQTK